MTLDIEKRPGVEWSLDRMLEVLKAYIAEKVELRAWHLETYLAAYLATTDIHPLDVVLVEEQSAPGPHGELRTVFRFMHKDEVTTAFQ